MPKPVQRITKKALRVELNTLRAKLCRYIVMDRSDLGKAYLEAFPAEQQEAIQAPREVLLTNLVMSAVYYLDNVFDL